MRPLFRQMQERLDGMGTEVLLQRDTDPAAGPNQLRDRQVARFHRGRELRPFVVASLYHNHDHFAFRISD
jgi:hypothetical protein